MLVAELLLRKKNIKLQIDELEKNLRTEDRTGSLNKTIGKLFELEDILQRYVVVLDVSNSKNRVVVGSSEVSIATAIRLKNNTKKKIDTLTNLIASNLNSVDIFNIIVLFR